MGRRSSQGVHPAGQAPTEFSSGEEINNYLLLHPEVQAHMQRAGIRPKVAMVFFDEETEKICAEMGYDLILPSAALREHLDSKIVTTKLGDEAGARSVPNVLTSVSSWDELVRETTAAGLGTDVVLQTPYGDSGKTTFFLTGPRDWGKYAGDIVGQRQKIMKRINHRAIAVEAVITRHGTVVGPFMTELTGHPELTPYQGGWCGNEMFPDALSGRRRVKANELVRRLGHRLAQEGYRGFFEVDVLVDTDDDEVYLGELNPRISGASSITNVTAGAYSDLPLFLFHLLEFMGVEYALDVDEINRRWEDLASVDLWSQMIIKETGSAVEQITSAARTGQWYFDATGELRFRRAALDWHRCRTRTSASSCGSTVPVTTVGRESISVCWSPRAGCRPSRPRTVGWPPRCPESPTPRRSRSPTSPTRSPSNPSNRRPGWTWCPSTNPTPPRRTCRTMRDRRRRV